MREKNTPAEYTTIYIAQGMLRAMTIQGCLESASIPVALSYESPEPILGLSSEGQGRVKVMVPQTWEKEARALLNANPRPGEIFCVPPE
ncbi:MAG: hypothetical protein E4H27_08235 [Anaerolineales bacterium]|nr:MAG: hypothetical protein E4H27_08235 [Anaerolineales bacterium]